MSGLPYQDIKAFCDPESLPLFEYYGIAVNIARDQPLVKPCVEKTIFNGMSYGLSESGYDIRLKQEVTIYPVTLKYLLLNSISRWTGKSYPSFALASSMEHFHIPNNIRAQLCDKSSWARKGLTVQNTVMEPGWFGWLTLELINSGGNVINIPAGSSIGQMIFTYLREPTSLPYKGKYQNQEDRPVESIKQQDT